MKLDFTQSEASEVFTKQIGAIATLMLQHKTYQYFPMACLKVWIEPAVILRQAHIVYDYRGVPVGYFTWAYLAEDVADRMRNDPSIILHFSEWNEGGELWIMDFVAVSGYAKSLVRYAMQKVFTSHSSARSLRRYADGRVKKVVHWKRDHAAAL